MPIKDISRCCKIFPEWQHPIQSKTKLKVEGEAVDVILEKTQTLDQTDANLNPELVNHFLLCDLILKKKYPPPSMASGGSGIRREHEITSVTPTKGSLGQQHHPVAG